MLSLTLLLACADTPDKPEAPDDTASATTDETEPTEPTDPTTDTDTPSTDDTATSTPPDDTGARPATVELLPNPGFEDGETWLRWPTDHPNHAWARTGESIYESAEQFTAAGGEYAQKIWGRYGDYPSETFIYEEYTGASAGDAFALTGQVFTHRHDQLSGDSEVTLYLRFFDGDWSLLSEVASEPLDATSDADTWHTLAASAAAPDGVVVVQAGFRFRQPDASSGGSAYLDELSLTGPDSVSGGSPWRLDWHDEFDGATIAAHWTPELLDAYTYNNELQAYTDRSENARVEDGALIIEARREDYDGADYTSARLVSASAGDWVGGRFEIRAQVPVGVGTWPAIWMLPTDWAYGGWPDSGEIDIMEHVGCDVGVVHGSVHTGAYNHIKGTQASDSISPVDVAGWHTYALEWDEDTVTVSLDDSPYFTFANDGAGDSATWPFDQRFHLILNVAVGGDWGGYCGVDAGAFPQQMRVDWVRVYQPR